jgi:deoxyxylulose-5-phosphate synthase
MSEKKMMIVPSELVNKINENRGDLSQAEFIEFLIQDQLGVEKPAELKDTTKAEIEGLRREIRQFMQEVEAKQKNFVTKEEANAFQEDTKKLMKSFLDFFIGYGLEFNKKSEGNDLSELSKTLDKLEKSSPDDYGKEVKIKWKNT